MPNSNQVFVDNAIPFGSRLETIGTLVAGSPPTVSGGVQLICENISLTYPTKDIRVPDQVGGPNGFVLVRDQPTGTCTIQIPMGSGSYNASTGGWDGVAWPTLGQGFVDRFLAANEAWVISQVGIPFEMNSYYKINCSIIQATKISASQL